MMRAIHWPAALHRVAEPIAVPAGEQLAGAVELCHLSPAMHAVAADIADEPGSLAAKSAEGPSDRHGLLDWLPLTAILPEVVMQRDFVPAALNLDLGLRALPVAPFRGPQAMGREQ